jgi:hypothetical protein
MHALHGNGSLAPTLFAWLLMLDERKMSALVDLVNTETFADATAARALWRTAVLASSAASDSGEATMFLALLGAINATTADFEARAAWIGTINTMRVAADTAEAATFETLQVATDAAEAAALAATFETLPAAGPTPTGLQAEALTTWHTTVTDIVEGHGIDMPPYLWGLTHAAQNAIQHALHGNGFESPRDDDPDALAPLATTDTAAAYIAHAAYIAQAAAAAAAAADARASYHAQEVATTTATAAAAVTAAHAAADTAALITAAAAATVDVATAATQPPAVEGSDTVDLTVVEHAQEVATHAAAIVADATVAADDASNAYHAQLVAATAAAAAAAVAAAAADAMTAPEYDDSSDDNFISGVFFAAAAPAEPRIWGPAFTVWGMVAERPAGCTTLALCTPPLFWMSLIYIRSGLVQLADRLTITVFRVGPIPPAPPPPLEQPTLPPPLQVRPSPSTRRRDVSRLWHLTHAAWNALQHALTGNGPPAYDPGYHKTPKHVARRHFAALATTAALAAAAGLAIHAPTATAGLAAPAAVLVTHAPATATTGLAPHAPAAATDLAAATPALAAPAPQAAATPPPLSTPPTP